MVEVVTLYVIGAIIISTSAAAAAAAIWGCYLAVD